MSEVEQQKTEEKVANNFSDRNNILTEFCLTIFVSCVVRETKLHEEFKQASENNMPISELTLKMRPKVANLSKCWFRCSHFINLMPEDIRTEPWS